MVTMPKGNNVQRQYYTKQYKSRATLYKNDIIKGSTC